MVLSEIGTRRKSVRGGSRYEKEIGTRRKSVRDGTMVLSPAAVVEALL